MQRGIELETSEAAPRKYSEDLTIISSRFLKQERIFGELFYKLLNR
jgi:hypothetical protein